MAYRRDHNSRSSSLNIYFPLLIFKIVYFLVLTLESNEATPDIIKTVPTDILKTVPKGDYAFSLNEVDATYESLNDILEILELSPSERDISEGNGNETGIASVSLTALKSTLVVSPTAETSGLTGTSTVGEATTPRDYYCIDPGIPSDLVIVPETDQYWEVGSVRSVSCLINPTSGFNSSGIFMTMGYLQPHLRHQVIDDHTIRATVNESEPGTYNLMCMTSFPPVTMCARKVFIGYAPLDVKDLVCVSWNLRVLECNWTVPENPVQLPSEDYLVYLVTNIGKAECTCEGSTGRCERQSESCMKTCCSWTNDYTAAEEFVTISFQVTNALGSNVFNHRIDNWASVIPDEAEDIVLTTSENSLEVRAQWNLPTYIGTLSATTGICYAVENRPDPAQYGERSWQMGSTGICRKKSCTAVMRVSYPGVEYQVRIRLRAGRENCTLDDDGWWSNWRPKNCSIPSQRPFLPPKLGPGTFQTGIGNSIVGQRDLTVNWNPLMTLEHNGPDFHYYVNATVNNGEPLPEKFVTDPYVTYSNISEESSIWLTVFSSNAIGESNISSKIVIRPTVLMPVLPILPVVVYHVDSQQYELIWNDEGHNYSHTVYICTDKLNTKDPCTGNLHWINVGSVTSINLTLSDFNLTDLGNKDVRFAVSKETSPLGISSGMSWDNCFHPQDYKQSTAPPTLLKAIATNASEATITWTLACQNRGGVVESVSAQWCQASNNFSVCQDLHSKTVTDVTSGIITLIELEPDTEYFVQLRIQYRENLSGWSTHRSFKTSPIGGQGLAKWLIGTIASGCVIMAVSIVICLTYSKQKINKFLIILKKPIHLPSGITDVLPPDIPREEKYPHGILFNSTGRIPVKESESKLKDNSIFKETKTDHIRQSVEGGRSVSNSNDEPEGSKEGEDENLIHADESSRITSSIEPVIDTKFPGYVQTDFLSENSSKIDIKKEGSRDLIPTDLPSKGYVAVGNSDMDLASMVANLVGSRIEFHTVSSSNGYVSVSCPKSNPVPGNVQFVNGVSGITIDNLPRRDSLSEGYVCIGNSEVDLDVPGDIFGNSTVTKGSGKVFPMENLSPKEYVSISSPGLDKNSPGVAFGDTNIEGYESSPFMPNLSSKEYISVNYSKIGQAFDSIGSSHVSAGENKITLPTSGSSSNGYVSSGCPEIDINVLGATYGKDVEDGFTDFPDGPIYVSRDPMPMISSETKVNSSMASLDDEKADFSNISDIFTKEHTLTADSTKIITTSSMASLEDGKTNISNISDTSVEGLILTADSTTMIPTSIVDNILKQDVIEMLNEGTLTNSKERNKGIRKDLVKVTLPLPGYVSIQSSEFGIPIESKNYYSPHRIGKDTLQSADISIEMTTMKSKDSTITLQEFVNHKRKSYLNADKDTNHKSSNNECINYHTNEFIKHLSQDSGYSDMSSGTSIPSNESPDHRLPCLEIRDEVKGTLYDEFENHVLMSDENLWKTIPPQLASGDYTFQNAFPARNLNGGVILSEKDCPSDLIGGSMGKENIIHIDPAVIESICYKYGVHEPTILDKASKNNGEHQSKQSENTSTICLMPPLVLKSGNISVTQNCEWEMSEDNDNVDINNTGSIVHTALMNYITNDNQGEGKQDDKESNIVINDIPSGYCRVGEATRL